MKRKKEVLNARQVRAGRNLLRWGAAGMNWAPGEGRDALMRQSRALLGRGAEFAAAFWAAAAQKAAGEKTVLTQTVVTELICAATIAWKRKPFSPCSSTNRRSS